VAAIAAGDRETGVALMVMDMGIDTGAVVSQERTLVADDDTSESLGARLGRMGAEMAVRDIPRWVEGELVALPQHGSEASQSRDPPRRSRPRSGSPRGTWAATRDGH
jgi:methionyl-tRNA formyltransferase